MSSDPKIYFSGHFPSRKEKRLTYDEAVELLVKAGWPKNKETLTTAVAVMKAESAGDPKAYLAYVHLPVDRNSELGLAMRKKIDALPKNITATSFRHEIQKIDPRIEMVRADAGLFQIGWPVHGENISDLMDPHFNAKRALKVYRDNGKTFNPWAAYTTKRAGEDQPPWKRFEPDARTAVNDYFDSLQPE